MRVCIAFHSCMDLGGIINHTEQLIGGLKDLGHKVALKELVYAENAPDVRRDGANEIGPSGIPFSQGKGWNFRRADRIPYKTTPGWKSAQQILNGFDLVIWTVPVPPKNKFHLGNNVWPELYNLDPRVKQIAFIHDGNARSGSPHLTLVQDKLSGIACVHHCSLVGASFLRTPRTLILNPQERPLREIRPWALKRPGFVNMQTFKAWKHVHELIEAISWMPPKKEDELREVAGKGIEYQYMTSIDKCKPEYYHSTQIESSLSGRPFWETALENGMTHHDYWDTDDVSNWLSEARILVDPSWSKRYSQIGGHWNRVVVDAMIQGCIPVAQERGMGSELFLAGVHFIDLGSALDAEDYANIILEAGSMPDNKAQEMIKAGRELLPMFDRLYIASKVISLAEGDIMTIRGHDDALIEEKARDLLFNHYGIA